ncbi:mitochondrial inner membrane protein COX18 [Pseudomyrmex gracilis]|uniref:mitochondrial inner membrane protein COX18 n=1 Tax=Pseudomyrmex gracilis TaxID=219809 RepID=UPI0009953F22|nr:mitochondrial inner membrane protein COX18 [Pseudomyrmex gracilis]
MIVTKVPKSLFLGQFKRVSQVNINNCFYFCAPSSLSHRTACDGCSTCASLNKAPEQYNLRANNNVSHPRIVSHLTLYHKNKHADCKTHRRHYSNVRYFSSVSSSVSDDFVPKADVSLQFVGFYKTLSESAPVRMTQDSLLWMHDCTGLPWWAVIVLATVSLRTLLTLPLSFYQQYIMAKLENLKLEMNQLVKEMKAEAAYGKHKYKWSDDYTRRLYNLSARKQWNKLIVRENCHPAKASLVVLVQIPLWVSLSVSIRNLCYMLPKQDASAYATYQEFINGGFLWMTNLTATDPFVLPLAMALFNLAIIEINCMSRVQEMTKWKKYLTNFFRIVAIGMIPLAMYVPSCVSLYWTTSSAFGLFQNLILLSPKLRRLAKVPVTASESPHPYALLRRRITARYQFKKRVDTPS